MSAAPAQETAYCRLQMGNELFYLPAVDIVEVLPPCTPYRVPLAPSQVVGVWPCHGDALLVLSLSHLLGCLPGPQKGTVIVVAGSTRRERFGLLVDAATQVVCVPTTAVDAVPPMLDDTRRALLAGVVAQADELVGVLSTAMLRPEQCLETR